ncbi:MULTISPECIES: cupin domain-containing protein [unclassified Xanthomonas]|uniref:cupin domain-containing protein n=1 Tax=Xanthomonas sp. LMG 8992 TaxID=1591157 RepID=UPI0031B702D2
MPVAALSLGRGRTSTSSLFLATGARNRGAACSGSEGTPYVWHVNDGQEVVVVLDGQVQMRWRVHGVEQAALLQAGDVFHAPEGTEHVAHPQGPARVLVVERDSSP